MAVISFLFRFVLIILPIDQNKKDKIDEILIKIMSIPFLGIFIPLVIIPGIISAILGIPFTLLEKLANLRKRKKEL